MKNTAQNHTPGAIRAAYAVMAARSLPVFKHDAEELAAIIDRETAAPELKKACELVAEAWRKSPRTSASPAERACLEALALCSPHPAQLARQRAKDSHNPFPAHNQTSP